MGQGEAGQENNGPGNTAGNDRQVNAAEDDRQGEYGRKMTVRVIRQQNNGQAITAVK